MTILSVRDETFVGPPPLPLAAAPDEHVPLGNALAIVRRRKWTVMLITAGLFIPLASVIFSLPRYYETQSSLLVDTGKTEFTDLQAHGGAVSGDTLMIHTQTDILLSRDMAGKVVDRIDLVHRPEVQQIIYPPAPMPGPWGVFDMVRHRLGLDRVRPQLLTRAEQRQVAVDWLLRHVTVRNDGRSYTLAISAKTNDAALSARIANAYASAYLDFMRDLKITTVAHAHEWLNEQIGALQARVAKAESRVEEFRRAHGLVLSQEVSRDGDQTTLTGRRMSRVDIALTEASNKLAEQQSAYDQVQAARRGGSLGALPAVVASPLVQRLSGELAELEKQRAGLGTTDMSESPRLRQLDSSIAGLRAQLGAEEGHIAGSLRAQVEATRAQVATLEARVRDLKGAVAGENVAEVQLRQLVSEAEAAEVVYRDYLTRFEQTSAQAAMQEPDAVLISYAQTPLGPSGPHRGQLTGAAGLLSLALGCFGAIMLERLRPGVRTLEQLEQKTTLFPLGVVPFAGRERRPLMEYRTSSYTLSVDHISNMLRHGDDRFRAQAVLVTSALPGEGKTFLSVALAASTARNHGRALIIDADIRRSQVGLSIRPTFRPPQGDGPNGSGLPGLTRDIMQNVDLITLRGARSNGSGRYLLDLKQLGAIIAEARNLYDLILVDMPPALVIPDAASAGRLVDGAVIAVRWQRTEMDAVLTTLRRLHACGVRVLGGILTQADMNDLGRESGMHAYLAQDLDGYDRA
ncbi:MAG: polysaccharide biosynthesis tyrosine autokinase [Gluconacetobacter sp.]|uniref:Polysaccharide biosynthesis tyrosine autokinase n=1 Tax=Gluconacetobacter dulcium TaxID=2729096 RepID=A0A7W4K076_9PROT|nr:polysaccharide biosynthesis tyrosine autokinase [Gluconacetobacter dulcium]MBB2197968.1 polysaccharide biosynthesis tyrosine autokinase [Gluconacetobacter dulcium]